VGYWQSVAGDGEGALEAFSRSVKADPKNAHAWSNLGVVQQQMGRFALALEAYKRCSKVNPKYERNWFNMGKVYQDLGRAEEAVDAFKVAVDASPSYFEVQSDGSRYPHCNALQHTAPCCNTPSRAAMYSIRCPPTVRCEAMSHVTHCTILQHTATHCSILQHTATFVQHIRVRCIAYVALLQ